MHPLLPQWPEEIWFGYWSGNGGLFAFASWDGQTANLWGVSERSLGRYRSVSQPVRLTYGPMSYGYFTPSKDGDQIFALGEIDRGELVARDPKTREFRDFLNGISAAYLDFSRDGQWVAYVTYPEGTLWRSRIDGSERLQLTFSPMGIILDPRWSPDGRFIAFTEWQVAGSRKIYMISSEGGSPLLLLAGHFNPVDPNWSPDGKSILYSGVWRGLEGEPEPTEIRLLNLDSKQSITIPGSQGLYSPRWSPDGHYIAAFSVDSQEMLLYSFEKPDWKLVTLPLVRKPGFADFEGWPSWSHDSRFLYVMGNSDVYKIQVPDGRPELAMGATGFDMTCPLFQGAWFGLTPDDRIIVLRDRGTDELYALDLEYR